MKKNPFRAMSLAAMLGLAVLAIGAVMQPQLAEAQTVGGWRKEVAEKAQAAQEAGQAGNYAKAISLLKEAKAKAPLSAEEEQGVNELMIWAASASRDYGLLASTIEERLATGRVKGAQLVSKLDMLAKTYYSQRNYSKAVDTLDKLAKARGSSNADDLIMLGQSNYALKRYPDAARTLEQAYTAAQKARKPVKVQVELLETLNNSYFRLGNTAKQTETLQKLMVVQPKVAHFEQLVVIAQKDGADSVAMINLFRLGDRKGVLAKEHYGKYADAALDLSSPGEAVRALEKGMAAGGIPKDDRNNRLLADSRAQVEKLKAGIAQQEREAKAIASGESDARLALTFLTLGDKAKAAEAAQRALQKGKVTRVDSLQFVLGVALYDQKKNAEARKSFDAAGSANPKAAGVAKLWSQVAG
ncbi:MAG: tetratricopeptide repeat protein [Steroidobacteraceae bacterium]